MTTASRDTLAVVLAHGGASATVLRHIPVWQTHAHEIVFFTPVDDPLPTRKGQYSVGKSKAYSADTNLRCREALRFASLTRFKYVLLFEYDSIIFGDIPNKYLPPPGGVSAPVFHEPNPGQKFQGSKYLHFPQLYTRSAVGEVVEAMDALPLDAEHGFTDRYVGLAVEKAGIPILDLNPTGFVCTHNEIDEAKLPAVLEKYRAGARWSHGVKSEKIFNALSGATA